MIGKILTREEILKLAEDQRSNPEVTKYSKSYRKED